MRRFFVSSTDVGAGHIIIRSETDIRHILSLLRLKAGEVLTVSDSQAWEYTAEIESIDGEGILLRILDKQRFSAEPDLKITLFQGVPKQGKMETIIQKSIEMGVSAIVPVFTARSVPSFSGPLQKKIERFRRVAAEAVKQCGRGIVPPVEDPVRTADLASLLTGFDLILLPWENEEAFTIKDRMQAFSEEKKLQTAALIIGPEGGFAKEEVEILGAHGARTCSLGKTILRTETAGPAAIAMIMYELEL